MMKRLILLALYLVTVALPLPAAAAPIVDQSNPTTNHGFCYLHDGAWCGQSFQQSHSTISGAGIYIDPRFGDGSNGDLTLSVFGAYDFQGPAGLLASGTVTNVNTHSGWVDVFWNATALDAGIPYYLVATSNHQIVAAYGSPDYADGNALYNGHTISYGVFDLTFRTYADDSFTQPVPEPGSISVLAIGLFVLGFALRKKSAYYWTWQAR